MRSDLSSGARPAPGGHDRAPRATAGLILGVAAMACALCLFLWLADEVMVQATARFDAAAVRYVMLHASPGVHGFMSAVTEIASGRSQTFLICFLTLILWARRRAWAEGIALLVAGFGAMLLDEWLKRMFHRVRPEPMYYHLGYSFPSGHAFSAVAIYGLLAYLLARAAPPARRPLIWAGAAAVILLVGASRVVLGQHYPTDVAGGYLAGACWLGGCVTWLRAMEARRRVRAAPDPPELD